MASKYLNAKIIIVQLLVMLVLFCGGVEAKGLEAGLWGMAWDSDDKLVKQKLEKNGFTLLDQGKDQDGKTWQKYGNGHYYGFQCDIEVVWQAKSLTEINIESKGIFLLGTDSSFRNLVARLTDVYGQPSERETYMLKIFPGIWVEGVKWTVTGKGEPSFEVNVVQNKPAPGPQADSAASEKIFVSFKNTVGKKL